MRSIRNSVIIVILFAASAVLALEEVPADQRTIGEKALLEASGGAHKIYRLWPEDGRRADDPLKTPNEKAEKKGILRINGVTRPSMMVIKPENPDGRGVLVFPGGGYNILGAEHEGTRVAEWLNGQGITVFLVKYRCPRRRGKPKHAVALQDALRAMRLVRKNADAFGVKADRIGVMGFSAGGHLSTLMCHQWDAEVYEEVDTADRMQARPDFAILIYPAYLVEGKEQVKLDPMVAEIKPGRIPVFITIGVKDRQFVTGAHKYAESLVKGNGPVDYHLYADGGHGKGLGGFPWKAACEAWLKAQADQ